MLVIALTPLPFGYVYVCTRAIARKLYDPNVLSACVAVVIAAMLLVGCGDKVSVDEENEAKVCADRFASAKVEELTPQEQKARVECADKAIKLFDRLARDPAIFRRYKANLLSALDGWVANGGKIEEIDSIVVPTCGRLVQLYATLKERKEFAKELREVWDMRVDFCVKGTVHRAHSQPEFENKELTEELCRPGGFWQIICERAGVAAR